MAQLKQFNTEEETQASYQSEQSKRSPDTRSAVSKADTMTEEERRAINRPGRGAFGEELTGEIPASARHVRPEELLEALAAVEARKGEAVVGTQPLGMALLRTNAHVSADVVWEEIQKQREKQVKAGATRKSSSRKRPPLWLQIGVGALCVGATFAAVRVLLGDISVVEQHVGNSVPPLTATVAAPVPKLREYSPDTLFIEQPGMVPLTNLPQGKPFFLSPHKAQQIDIILNGDQHTLPVPKEQLKNYYFTPNNRDNDFWNTIILNGKVYVRGWVNIPPGTKKGDLLNTQIQIFNRPDVASSNHLGNLSFGGVSPAPSASGQLTPRSIPPTEHLRPISIPASAFQSISSTSSNGYSTMLTKVIHLDNSAWENWTPLPLPPDPYRMNISHGPERERNVYIWTKNIRLPARPWPTNPTVQPGVVVRGGTTTRIGHW